MLSSLASSDSESELKEEVGEYPDVGFSDLIGIDRCTWTDVLAGTNLTGGAERHDDTIEMSPLLWSGLIEESEENVEVGAFRFEP